MNLSDNLTSREWRNILQNEFSEKYFKELNKFLNQNKGWHPRPEFIFQSLNLTSYNNTKVVIVNSQVTQKEKPTRLMNQGVLFLDIIPTKQNKVSHLNIGWEEWSNKIISALDNREKPVVFVLLGKRTEKIQDIITSKHHYIIKSSNFHKKVNELLQKTGQKPVNWEIVPKENKENELFK